MIVIILHVNLSYRFLLVCRVLIFMKCSNILPPPSPLERVYRTCYQNEAYPRIQRNMKLHLLDNALIRTVWFNGQGHLVSVS